MSRRSRRQSLGYELDYRTTDLPDRALHCRSNGHSWNQPMVQSSARRIELFRQGSTEIRTRCSMCGSVRVQEMELGTGKWTILSTHIEYSDGYLLAEKGTGRLPRSEARGAWWTRQMGWA